MMWSNLLGLFSLEQEYVGFWGKDVRILSCMNTSLSPFELLCSLPL